MDKNIIKNLLFLCFVLIALGLRAIAGEPPNLTVSRLPLNEFYGINANFGEYRGWGTYAVHDGIDYQTRDSHKNSTQEVFPVEEGTYSVHLTNDTDFGKFVIVSHPGGFQTRYAHLSQISAESDGMSNINDSLGLSGNTHGTGGKSTGPHLHFGLGIPNVNYLNTVNPIWAGLKQPKYGELKIYPSPYDNKIKIRILSTGKDDAFTGGASAGEIKISKPGEAVRAVIQAYHLTRKNGFGTNPFKIELNVEKEQDPSWPKVTKIITFETMGEIMANLNEDYNFIKPCVTGPFNTPAYYFVEFAPTAGKYKITAKIFSCYRDDFGFHLSEPEITTREIMIGLNGDREGDLDFYDPSLSYAWLPDDISGDKGIMLASTSFSGGGISATAIGAKAVSNPPEIFYAYANNNVITNNMIDVDPNLQQKALIESRTRGKSDWDIQFFNEGGAKVDEIKVIGQDWLRTGARRRIVAI